MQIPFRCILAFAAVFSFVPPAVAQDVKPQETPYFVVPGKQVVMENVRIPRWKKLWDEARQLALQGNIQEAIKQYRVLLDQKENLEEAKWELARLYIHLQQWDDGAGILELLLEENPGNADYLNSLGRVMWEKKQYERAVDLFGKANRVRPDDYTSLAGLVDGLLKLGRPKEALPAAERLHQLRPDDAAVRRNLAFLALDMGDPARAKPHLVALAGKEDADQEILLKTAQMFENLKSPGMAVPYWQRFVVKEPGNRPAHRKLADHYIKINKNDEALKHLSAILKNNPEETGLYAKMGELALKTGQTGQAMAYLEKHLQKNPKDNMALRSIVRMYASLGETEKTMAALEQYFAVRPVTGETENLKLAARLQDAAGRFQEAIPLYRQLTELFPNDPEILTALVNDLLAIGENEGALHMWQHLAKVTADRVPIYRAMAGLLENLDREDELLEILKILHKLDPADEPTNLKLASIYAERQDTETALGYLNKLPQQDGRSPEFYLQRGSIFQKIALPWKALHDYEVYLQADPGNFEIRQQVIMLAGKLGLADKVFDQFAWLAGSPQFREASAPVLRESALTRAEALRELGFFADALRGYGDLPSDTDERSDTLLQTARVYLDAGLSYEAEQMLRQVLVLDRDRQASLRQLLEMTLEDNRLPDAEIWLQALNNTTPVIPDWQLRLYQARLLFQQGEYRQAIRICQRLHMQERSGLSTQSSQQNVDPVSNDILHASGLLLCRLQFQAGKFMDARQTARGLQAMGWNEPELLVLLEQIYIRTLETDEASAISARIMKMVADRPAEMVRLAELYDRYDDGAAMLRFASILMREMPDSLKARFLFARALEARGEFTESYAVLNGIAEKYPGNTRAVSESARLLFRMGRFDEALTRCQAILVIAPERHDILLLKARSLWALKKWKEAVAVYTDFLEPSIDDVLAKHLQSKSLRVELAPKQTFFRKITFTRAELPKLSETVMAADHAADSTADRRRINVETAGFYALYRWQARFADELAARRAVQRREYYQAAYLYKVLLRNHATDDSLVFDLAGIYSRLGRLGEETALYEDLLAHNPGLPGLNAAMERNRLKRRPQFSLEYSHQEEKGWNSYKSMEKERSGAAMWLVPATRHEARLDVSRLRYQSTADNREIKGNRVSASYKLKPLQGLSLVVDGGLEALENGAPDNNVFSFALYKEFGDKLQGDFKYFREITADTIASLSRGITTQNTEGGLSLDLLPRLLVGGDYVYREYSDSNQQEEYDLRASYSILPEPFFLQLTYRYDYLESSYGRSPGPPTADGYALYDHPYWCPASYWVNGFSLYLKHQLSENTLERGVPRYYTMEYSLGHDSRGYEVHQAKAGFFVECNRHVILSAALESYRTEDYNRQGFFASLAYRW